MLTFLNNIPPETATFIAAMLPVTELRGSIPVAIEVWDLDPLTSYIASVLGNLVPMVLILYFFEPIQRSLSSRFIFMRKFFEWLFARTRRKLDANYKKYGLFALCLFVAIPLPVTGVWTGSIAAWLFDIKKIPAMLFISLGAIIAGIVVTLLTLGVGFIF